MESYANNGYYSIFKKPIFHRPIEVARQLRNEPSPHFSVISAMEPGAERGVHSQSNYKLQSILLSDLGWNVILMVADNGEHDEKLETSNRNIGRVICGYFVIFRTMAKNRSSR